MIYDELRNSATSRQCLYKAPLRTDNTAFHWSKTEYRTVFPSCLSGWRAVVDEEEGAFYNLGLVHGAVG